VRWVRSSNKYKIFGTSGVYPDIPVKEWGGEDGEKNISVLYEESLFGTMVFRKGGGAHHNHKNKKKKKEPQRKKKKKTHHPKTPTGWTADSVFKVGGRLT